MLLLSHTHLTFYSEYIYTVLWELTSSIFVAQIREPPHVAQANSKTHTGHDEVHLSGPGFSLRCWYCYRPISSRSIVLGLRWATPSAVIAPWAHPRHRHQRASWCAALLLRQYPCVQLGNTDFTWTEEQGWFKNKHKDMEMTKWH